MSEDSKKGSCIYRSKAVALLILKVCAADAEPLGAGHTPLGVWLTAVKISVGLLNDIFYILGLRAKWPSAVFVKAPKLSNYFKRDFN